MNDPYDYNRLFDILETQYGRDAVNRLVAAMLTELRRWEREPSLGHVRLWAQGLLTILHSTEEMYHFGKKDTKNLKRFSKAAEEAINALHQLSPWAEQAVSTAMRQLGDDYEAPSSIVLRIVNAARQAELMMDKGPVQGRVNWKAVSIVGEARRCWGDLYGVAAPERALNEATPFGDFLYAIFEALELDANPKAAFLSWRKREDEQISY